MQAQAIISGAMYIVGSIGVSGVDEEWVRIDVTGTPVTALHVAINNRWTCTVKIGNLVGTIAPEYTVSNGGLSI